MAAAHSRLPQTIAHALGSGATILTGSARAARALTLAYAQAARAQGLLGWRAPAIADWTTWTTQLYGRLSPREPLPLLLTAAQEQALWARVQTQEASSVVAPGRLAQLAQSAWSLLGAYNAHRHLRAPWAAAHEDAERFLAWAAAFRRECEQLDAASCSQLELLLHPRAAALAASLPTPRTLLLVGFDRLTPAQQLLLQALATHGVSSQQISLAPPAAAPRVLCAGDEEQELQACAHWLANQLASTHPGKNPEYLSHQPSHADPDPDAMATPRLAILLPQLADARAAIDRVFPRFLSALPGSDQLPYEFSLGMPLAQVPLIHAALLLLRWLAGPLPAAEFTLLLLSGFAAQDEAEQLRLAQTDAELRRRGLLTPELSLDTLLRHAARYTSLLPPGLRQRLSLGRDWAREFTRGRSQPCSAWASQVPALLASLGWPGYRPLTSTGFQAQERWTALLEQTAHLDLVSPPGSWLGFVSILATLAHQQIFAPQSRNAPVQILGLAEAAGQTFDALWLLQATEDRWPSTGRPHPLLSPALQRDAGMPHTSPQADQALAQVQLERVLSSATQAVFSYASQGSTTPSRPSPLLRNLPSASPFPQASSRPFTPIQAPSTADPFPSAPAGPHTFPSDPVLQASQAVNHRSPSLEAAQDLLAFTPPLDPPYSLVREADDQPAPWPGHLCPGGSEVLKAQAACAFQSFARKRLAATPLGDPAWGLDPAERGQLLHHALEQLWTATPNPEDSVSLHSLPVPSEGSALDPPILEAPELGTATPSRLHTRDDLQRAIATGTIDALLEGAITRALARLLRQAALHDTESDRWLSRYLGLERRRLHTRLRRWLDVEQDRAPFTVLALERRLERVPVGPLWLNLRLDRADCVAGNRTLLLDYKTGAVANPSQWAGPRPDEPQLPLYALFAADVAGLPPVAGIGFAHIHFRETKLHGLAEDPTAQLSPALTRGSTRSAARTAEDSLQTFSQAPTEFEAGGAAPDRKPEKLDKRLLTPETRAQWHEALLTLAEAFAGGDASLNPKRGEPTCSLCGLHGVCRVRSQAAANFLLAEAGGPADFDEIDATSEPST